MIRKWTQSRLLFCSALLILISCFYCSNSHHELRKKLQATLDRIREESGFPGATMAVILDDGSALQFATGWADDEKRIKMKPTDRIFSGSVGKTFVSAVVLQLYNEGHLMLDDKVSRYFRGEVWFSRLPNHEDITIRMLLNHTGGLPRHIFQEGFGEEVRLNPDKTWEPVELLAYIFDVEPVHPAGDGWSYSDTDYILLGMVIEKITGNTYYKELDRRILTPLNLTRISPSVSREIEGLVPGLTGDAPPFNLRPKVLVDGRMVINPQLEWTGGGLVTTSLDFARWSKFLYEGEVVPRRLVDEMLRAVNTETGQPDSTGYGLGVQVWRSDYGLIYGHGGIFPGYQTQMEYLRDLKCAITLQVNADRFSGRLDRSLHEFVGVFLPVLARHISGYYGD